MAAPKNAGKVQSGWFQNLTLAEPHHLQKQALVQTRKVDRTRKPVLLLVDWMP